MGQLLGDPSLFEVSHVRMQSFPKTWPHGSTTGCSRSSSSVKGFLQMGQVFRSSRRITDPGIGRPETSFVTADFCLEMAAEIGIESMARSW